MKRRIFAAILALGIIGGGAAAVIPAVAATPVAAAPRIHYYE